MTITADDLRAAQREFERRQRRSRAAQDRHGKLRGRQQHRLPPGSADTEPAAKLLLCQGDNYEAVLGVKTLRTLRTATGLQYQRVLDATRHKLAEVIKISTGCAGRCPCCRLRCPPAAEGITFQDKPADATWLRKALAGVPVLLLTDYRGEPSSATGWTQSPTWCCSTKASPPKRPPS